jgi:hypothetical protein
MERDLTPITMHACLTEEIAEDAIDADVQKCPREIATTILGQVSFIL